MKVGDVLFRPDNCNVVLVLEIDLSRVITLYLDNEAPEYVGTVFEHDVLYIEWKYTQETVR